MVGNRADVSSNTACGIRQTGAVLDLHASEGIGVVAAPDLRTEVQHACVYICNKQKISKGILQGYAQTATRTHYLGKSTHTIKCGNTWVKSPAPRGAVLQQDMWESSHDALL